MDKNDPSTSPTEEDNPYSSPSANLLRMQAESAAIDIREAHINHEASLKAAGILFYIFGGLILIVVPLLFLIFDVVVDQEIGTSSSVPMVYLCLAIIYGVATIVAGRGLYGLQEWTKGPVGIICGLSLLNFPVGTFFAAYILYVVFCKKGSVVFSEEYQQIISETPHVAYKASRIITIVLLMVLASIVLSLIRIEMQH